MSLWQSTSAHTQSAKQDPQECHCPPPTPLGLCRLAGKAAVQGLQAALESFPALPPRSCQRWDPGPPQAKRGLGGGWARPCGPRSRPGSSLPRELSKALPGRKSPHEG